MFVYLRFENSLSSLLVESLVSCGVKFAESQFVSSVNHSRLCVLERAMARSGGLNLGASVKG
jgi:hypothetical protein